MAKADERGRGQWVLKHVGITPEFLALVRKAAERSGASLYGWVVDTLTAAAQRTLKGEGAASGDTAGVPARAEDLADLLGRRVDEIVDKVDARIDARLGELRQQAPPPPPRPLDDMLHARRIGRAVARGRRRRR